MKRLWISVVLLLLILAGSLCNAWYAKQLTDDMGERLYLSQSLARQGRWEDALAITQEGFHSLTATTSI